MASDPAALLSAFAMYRAFPGSDYYADSATPRAHRPASGLAGPPGARRPGALPTFTVLRFTGSLSLYLSVSLARARASGSTARPSRCRGCSHRWVHDPAPRLPPASPGRCISPGPASQPARVEMSFALTHLLSHSASWRTEEVASKDGLAMG